MHEYTVDCLLPSGKYEGKQFALLSDAQQYMKTSISSSKFTQVRLFDAVDNLLDDWVDEDPNSPVLTEDGEPDITGRWDSWGGL